MQDIKWFSGDLHEHSEYSSAKFGGNDNAPDTLLEVYDFMISKGLSFGAASDHHNILNHAEWQKFKTDTFLPIISKEISTSCGHVMALDCPVDVIFNMKDKNLEQLKQEMIRVINEIKQNGGIAQINHPCDPQKAISLPVEFYDILHMFDTFEVWNGSEPFAEGSKNWRARSLWFDTLKKGVYIPITSGTDVHRLNEFFPLRNVKTMIFTNSISKTEVLNAIKNGNSYVTSGPLAQITINEKCYGQTAKIEKTAIVNLDVKSSTEIDKILIHTNLYTKELEVNCKELNTSLDFTITDEKWFVFEIGTDTFNKAFTNPIFIEKC